MSVASKFFNWVIDNRDKEKILWLFERLLGAYFVVQASAYLPVKEIFWGQESLFAVSQGGKSMLHNLFYLLTYNRWMDDAVYYTHLIAAVWMLSGKRSWLSKVLVYLTGYILYYAAYYTFNGGLLAALNWTFFLCFSFPAARWGVLQTLTNIAWLGCLLQLMLIYAVAASAKWIGTDWLEGSAVYYALHLEYYASYWARDSLGKSTILSLILTYIGLAYQSLFPVVIWFKRWKYPFLVVGVLFHLGIIVVLNLYDFGVVMILGYVILLNPETAGKVMGRIPLFFLPRGFREVPQ